MLQSQNFLHFYAQRLIAEISKHRFHRSYHTAVSYTHLDVYKRQDKNGGNDVLKSPELIFERRNGESVDFEANKLPISDEKG